MGETVGAWLGMVHEMYPPQTSADWDRIGLQVGDPGWPVERVLVSLDVTSDVIEEAGAVPATLLLVHHPPLFQPLDSVTPSSPGGRIALGAARAGVAIVAAHTNLDVAVDGAGTSDPVAELLRLVGVRPLEADTRGSPEVKLVTFVPHEHVGDVLDALSVAGAGVIGQYERCSFRVEGTGTFRPREGTDPFSGQVGEDNEERELRLEIVVERPRIAVAVEALLAAHPYEEVAYDLYPLIRGGRLGMGRVGELEAQQPLREVADLIHRELPAPVLRTVGDPDRTVRRVAVVGGAGASLVPVAVGAGADVLVTGDVKHHEALGALELGLALIDAGHHATENAAVPAWIGRLREESARRGLTAEVVASSTPTDPFSPPE